MLPYSLRGTISSRCAAAAAVRRPRIRRKSDVLEALRVAACHRVQIGPQPDEAVDLAHDRPGAGFVEAKRTLYGEWNLHAIARMIRRIMRDRHHRHDRLSRSVF
jgi:hypothetical protein